MADRADHRRHPRLDLTRWAKVYDRRSRRYRPARTLNVSAGGALLEVRGGFDLAVGDALDLLINFGDRPFAAHADLVPVTVVRRAGESAAALRLGVRFAKVQPLALAA